METHRLTRIFGLTLALLLAVPARATVAKTTSSAGPYTCDGSKTAFSVPFRFLATSDLQVTRTPTGGTVTATLALGTDYTVTGAGGSSGTVTLTLDSKCARGYTLTIKRVVPLTQTTPFVTQGSYKAKAHEFAFDRLTMGLQQVDHTRAEDKATQAMTDAQQNATIVSGDSAERAFVTSALAGIGAPEANATRITAQETHTFGWVSAKEYGAHAITEVGYETFDSQPGIMAALASKKPVLLPGIYRIDAPVTIGAGEALFSIGGSQSRGGTLVAHVTNRPAIRLTGGAPHFSGIDIYCGVANRCDGISLAGAVGPVVKDFWIQCPRKGIVIESGESNYGSFTDFAVHQFSDTGIDLSNQGNGAISNSSYFQFKELSGRPAVPALSTETYGIRTGASSVSEFQGGEISGVKYAFEALGTQNRYQGIYVENSKTMIVGGIGPHYFDSHLVLNDPPQIAPGTAVEGPSALNFARYSQFTKPQASAEDLRALYYFDEIVNGKVLDQSGHGYHLDALGGANTFVSSPIGKALWQDVGASKGTSWIPVGAVNWSQPFSVLMLMAVDQATPYPTSLALSWGGPSGYFRFWHSPAKPDRTGSQTSWFGNYDNATLTQTPHSGGTAPFVYYPGTNNQTPWVWVGLYVSPPAGAVQILDYWSIDYPLRTMPMHGLTAASQQLRVLDNVGGTKGAVAFLALWQREVKITEVQAIINQRAQWLPTPRSTPTVSSVQFVGSNGTACRQFYTTAAPASCRRCDLWWNVAPRAGASPGGVCTAANTWKAMANLAP